MFKVFSNMYIIHLQSILSESCKKAASKCYHFSLNLCFCWAFAAFISLTQSQSQMTHSSHHLYNGLASHHQLYMYYILFAYFIVLIVNRRTSSIIQLLYLWYKLTFETVVLLFDHRFNNNEFNVILNLMLFSCTDL